jgi:hypothetical protein
MDQEPGITAASGARRGSRRHRCIDSQSATRSGEYFEKTLGALKDEQPFQSFQPFNRFAPFKPLPSPEAGKGIGRTEVKRFERLERFERFEPIKT